MAEIILGTVQFGLEYGINNKAGKPGVETVFEMLDQAHQSGIQTLDTADAYGNATALIGMYHRKGGKKFKVNTKFFQSSPGELKDKLKASIAQLDVEQVNIYFYHSYNQYATNPLLEKALQQLKEEKLILQTGLSVYTNDEFETALNDKQIDVIQLPFNLLDNYNQRGNLLQKAKAKGKLIQARSVFLQGLFFKPMAELPEKLAPLSSLLEELHQMSGESGIPMENICLQYAASIREIDEIIIGIDNPAQLGKNLAALDKVLPPMLLEKINHIKVADTSLLYPYNWNTN